MDVYGRYGITPVINAAGDYTKFGGTLMESEVVSAMAAASRHFVKISELQSVASGVVADFTGSEAGHVTSGAASAIALSAAVCIGRHSQTLLMNLPRLEEGCPSRILLQESHLNPYARMFELSGGSLEFIPGEELERELSGGTVAAVGYVHERSEFGLDIAEVVRLAHRYDVPVIVDAANSLPPISNLRRYVDTGADLVAVSGGKALHGPQATGFVCGSSELVKLVSRLQLDYGNPLGQTGLARHGLGRPMKVAKEEIIGLLIAIERFRAHDHDEDYLRWSRLMRGLASDLDSVDGVVVEYRAKLPNGRPVPCVVLKVDDSNGRFGAKELLSALEEGERRVAMNDSLLNDNALVINPANLRDDEVPVVYDRIREEVRRAKASGLL